MINGRGRAPLIVVPDTGTRLQTKWDRAEAGCHAQSPPAEKTMWLLLPRKWEGGGGVEREVTGCVGDDSKGESKGRDIFGPTPMSVYQSLPYLCLLLADKTSILQ